MPVTGLNFFRPVVVVVEVLVEVDLVVEDDRLVVVDDVEVDRVVDELVLLELVMTQNLLSR